MDIIAINDLRQRILRVKQLRADGEEIPEGLTPTTEELRDALIAARAHREELAANKGKRSGSTPTSTRSKGPKLDSNFDLNSLFDGG